MANYCNNFINCKGEDFRIIGDELQEMCNSWMETYEGQYFDIFFDLKIAYRYNALFELYEIELDEKKSLLSFNCRTKWKPPIRELKFLVDNYGISEISCEFDELGQNLFGIWSYKDQKQYFFTLNEDDFKKVKESDDLYYISDMEFIDIYDAYDHLLMEKIKLNGLEIKNT